MSTGRVQAWMSQAVRRRTRGFSQQMRNCPDGSLAVPGLDWTVADLGQHVASLPEFWMTQCRDGADFRRPDDFAAYSDQARSHLAGTDPAVLADLIDDEFGRCLDWIDNSGDQLWLYGTRVTPADMCGVALHELVLHGRDLAPISGATKPAFERDEANLVVDASMLTAPAFIDRDRARAQPDGVYHIKFRGGRDYTWTKAGDRLLIEAGRPARADARLNTDPAVYLLASLGRYSQVMAGLTGAMVAYGAKPWRFLGLGSMIVDGV